MNDIFETKDKQLTPYLLIQPDVKFLGSKLLGTTIYFLFAPKDRCEKLVNAYLSRQAPLVQAKDLLDSVESYRDMVFEMKEKGKNHGSSQT
ncbi:MAG: hypothetical protein ACOZBZ_04415 [Patescibacteria group bacterium]